MKRGVGVSLLRVGTVVLIAGGAVLTVGPSASPLSAYASVLPSDRVGSVAVGSRGLAKRAPDVDLEAGEIATEDGRVLWSRRPGDERAMASITKVMTALVVLDRLKLTDTLKVPAAALEVGQSDSELTAGERLTVREALEALLVKSGNDAAVALAIRTAGSENAFTSLMNRKAKELGLTHTRYANSYGLDEPGHFTSADDVATLSRFAMTYPEFRRIVGLRSVRIGRESNSHLLEASNRLLADYPGANGVKTGWTNDAGYCVAASASRGGQELIAVVLGARSESKRFKQAAKLLDWGFANYGTRRLVAAGSQVGTAAVTDYDDRFVRLLTADEATRSVFAFDGPIVAETRFSRSVDAPIAKGERLGVLEFTQGGRHLASVALVSDRAVAKPRFLERVRISLARLWRSLFD